MPLKAENSLIKVTGAGNVDMQKFKNPFQARKMAERAAMVDAQRKLFEQIQGIEIDASTTVKDLMAVEDSVTTKVQGFLRGAFVVDKNVRKEDGYYVAEVEMALCLNNKNNLCKGRIVFNLD